MIKQGVVQEKWAKLGLTFIRKSQYGKPVYFVANVGNSFQEGWISPGKLTARVEQYDPLTNTSINLSQRNDNNNNEIFLSLKPGQSCFLRESANSGETVPVFIQQNNNQLREPGKLIF